MSHVTDWSWKLREAAERIKNRYEHIGRKTAAPFLAIVYPADQETQVIREWHGIIEPLRAEFDFKTIDLLDVTTEVLKEMGCEHIVASMQDPMPGSSPEAELGQIWISTVVSRVRERIRDHQGLKPVVVLERLGALYPAAGPRSLMQALWDSEHQDLDTPVVLFIPGTLVQPRVYSFLNKDEEFMYRGDIL